MLKHISKYITLFLALNSCSDVIEPSLIKEEVKLISPVNNDSSSIYTQTFWWEKVNNAINYNLQIVSPSFENVKVLILDSIITGNKFTCTLQPGKYQWRLRAQNGSSQTAYKTQNFTIAHATPNNQNPQLTLSENSETANASLVLSWILRFETPEHWLSLDTISNLEERDSLFMVYSKYITGLYKLFSMTNDQIFTDGGQQLI